MNTNDLKLFEAVALHGNFTKAAEAMFTVQSNVSVRIKSIEREFGAKLFLRSSRNVELTSAGKVVLQCCKQVNNIIEETKTSLAKHGSIKGQIKLGFLETAMILKGPNLVNEMAEKYPLVDINLRSALRDKLIDDVLSFKLDAAFIPEPVNRLELEQLHVSDERIVAVLPAEFTHLDELLGEPQIRAIFFDRDCFFRARLESWLANHSISNYHKTVLHSIEEIIHFIESGIVFSFFPYEIISRFYSDRKLKIFSLPVEIGTVKTILIYRRDNLSSPVLKALLSLYS